MDQSKTHKGRKALSPSGTGRKALSPSGTGRKALLQKLHDKLDMSQFKRKPKIVKEEVMEKVMEKVAQPTVSMQQR